MDRIEDFDDAYANMAHVPDGAAWPARWEGAAAAFRDVAAQRARLGVPYGEGEREWLDLFMPEEGLAPEGGSRGLVVFVHGGYWIRFGPRHFSHLAAGSLARGFAVAMPAYPLAPSARVADLVRAVARGVAHAASLVPGPIVLTGHSAGGHLATRLVCDDALLPGPVAARVARCVSISGVHDLRPMLRTALNGDIRLDADEARAESPALMEPRVGTRHLAWVGQAERAEFVRQSALIANVWRGLGAEARLVVEPDRHHFDVIEALASPDAPLTRAVLEGLEGLEGLDHRTAAGVAGA